MSQEANRQRALDRLQRKGLASSGTSAGVGSSGPANVASTTVSSSTNNISSAPVVSAGSSIAATSSIPVAPPLKRPRIELTPEQRKRIEENRKRALEIQRQKQLQNRNAEQTAASTVPMTSSNTSTAPIPGYTNVRLPKELSSEGGTSLVNGKPPAKQYQPPSINKKDYIEYDFSTMKDSYGGFIDETGGGIGGAGAPPEENPTLEAWKERQKQQLVVRELPPPLDISAAPKCEECQSMEIDQNIYQNFRHVRVCRPCARAKPERYALLTKTECKEDYLLTDPELKDVELLPRVEKPNPHGFSRMQLFLRLQVEEYAWKKWGGADKLDEEWEKRERVRLQRKEKKYEEKLKEMRKRTRAEEYTRKLRNGESLGQRHVHDWSEPLVCGENVKRRCIDCGLETEELIL